MFLSGDPLRAPGPQGEQQRDRSFLVWFNARDEAVDVTQMENPWIGSGEVVLSTCPDNPAGTEVHAGDTITVSARSLVLLRQH